MKQFVIPYLLFFCLIMLCACGKDEEETIIKPPGTFTALIDGKAWEPFQYNAIYFPRLHSLHILAKDYDHKLISGVQLDLVSPLKTYTLESHGNNVAHLGYNSVTYASDQNVAIAGGTLQLLKLDTINGKVSAALNFTGYAAGGGKAVFASQAITDIGLKIDTSWNDENVATCTVKGATTTNWYSNEVWGAVNCISDGVNKTMDVEIASVIGGFPYRRYLLFQVPLNLPVGTYPIRPDLAPYFYCGRLDVTCRYSLNDDNNAYYATAGSFTITSIDKVARKLTATFQVTVKDTSARQETIQITNGQLKLNNFLGW